ncbi:MAG: transcription termination/antitermination protein NusA [Eubacterium sp.]|nr:transcription termination/antitermination protein NusA [Eubacterium sp.]
MSKEFFEAVKMLEAEKGIAKEQIYDNISQAVISSLKREYGGKDVVYCEIDEEKQRIKVFVRKEVVEEVEDPDVEISLEDAQQLRKSAKVGKTIDIPIKTKELGRIIAQKAKHSIRQGLRDAERSKAYEEFRSKTQELVTAVVDRIDPITGVATLNIGKSQTMLPKAEQVPGETLKEGAQLKIFIVDVKETTKGPKVMVSRTHPGLVRRLFEQEVPEIYDGTIEIKSVSREAGSRSKIAVYTNDEDVDAVGACIGPRGQRVSAIVDALGGEKIDIVKYSEDPAEFVAASLAPSEVISVTVINEEEKTCRAIVPDDQLSLAIGNKGQNVRLAVRLTGWNIDIKPESEADAPFETEAETENE